MICGKSLIVSERLELRKEVFPVFGDGLPDVRLDTDANLGRDPAGLAVAVMFTGTGDRGIPER